MLSEGDNGETKPRAVLGDSLQSRQLQSVSQLLRSYSYNTSKRAYTGVR